MSKLSASDKDLEAKLTWRAACKTTYLGHDAGELLALLRRDPVAAWELIESTSGLKHLKRTAKGRRVRRKIR